MKRSLSQAQKQEMVEAVVLGMATQGAPAISEAENCYWLTPEGHRCGVAMLMTDEEISALGQRHHKLPNFIGGDASKFSNYKRFDEPSATFVAAIQGAHDDAARDVGIATALTGVHDNFLSHFEQKMRELCEEWDLRFPEEYL